MSEKYVLIIETDQYTGNFEREMCAFCTGVVGDCEVGDKEKAKFIGDFSEEKADEMWELLEQRADDNGCRRPVSMCGLHNNRLEIYFYDRPSKDVLDMIRTRAERFTHGVDRIWEKPRTMKILGVHMRKETTTCEPVEI